jgi:HSP20 family protein
MSDQPSGGADLEKEEKERKGASWRPLSDWGRWEQEMGRRFDDLLERRWNPLRPKWWPGSESGPPVDLYEEDDEIVARIELPGMDKNDIELSLTDQALSIRGEKKKQREIKEEYCYRSEFSYGAFTRVIDLPHEVQADKVRASFDRGVLEVRLPKSETARKRSTKIEIG